MNDLMSQVWLEHELARDAFRQLLTTYYKVLAEEGITHLAVIMLARVDQNPFIALCSERAEDGRDLHEVRPRPRHYERLHFSTTSRGLAGALCRSCSTPERPTTRALPLYLRIAPRVSTTRRACSAMAA